MRNSAQSSSEQLDQQQSDDGDSGSDTSGRSAFASALAQELEKGEPADPDDSEQQRGTGGESRNQPVPKNLEGLAERLGIEVAKLYDIAIPAGHGREPMTLGKLKDRFGEWASLEADRLAFSEERVQSQAAHTRGMNELRELIALLPKEALKPELLTRAAERAAERNRQLEAQLPTIIPEWKDEATQKADREGIAKMLEGYGYSAPEVKALRDPRLLRVLRDAMNRETLVRKALEAVKRTTKKPQQQQPAARGAPRREQPQQQRQTGRPVSGREQFLTALRQEG